MMDKNKSTYNCNYTSHVMSKRKIWRDGLVVAHETHGFVRLVLYEYDESKDTRGRELENMDIFNVKHSEIVGREFTTNRYIIDISSVYGSHTPMAAVKKAPPPVVVRAGLMKRRVHDPFSLTNPSTALATPVVENYYSFDENGYIIQNDHTNNNTAVAIVDKNTGGNFQSTSNPMAIADEKPKRSAVVNEIIENITELVNKSLEHTQDSYNSCVVIDNKLFNAKLLPIINKAIEHYNSKLTLPDKMAS